MQHMAGALAPKIRQRFRREKARSLSEAGQENLLFNRTWMA
jgi:hypothetical protein